MTSEDQTYRVGMIAFWWLGVLVILTVGGAPVLTSMALAGDEAAPWPLAVVWLSVLLLGWYEALYDIPYKVTLFADGWIEFKALLRARRVHSGEVTAIWSTVGRLDVYSLTVQTAGRKIHMIRMPGLFDFCTRLRELNPSVDLSGLYWPLDSS